MSSGLELVLLRRLSDVNAMSQDSLQIGTEDRYYASER